jgi:hypothetical protein
MHNMHEKKHELMKKWFSHDDLHYQIVEGK